MCIPMIIQSKWKHSSVVEFVFVVAQDVLPPLHHLPVQALHDMLHPCLQSSPLATLLQHCQLFSHHPADPLVRVGVVRVKPQRFAALHDEFFLDLEPVAEGVELGPVLLEVLVDEVAGQSVVEGSDDVHVVGEGLLVFGEVEGVELRGLEQHVEHQHLHEHHQGQQHLLQGLVGTDAPQVLRNADGLHLEGRPEPTHHETAPTADVEQDLGKQGDLAGSALLLSLLQSDLHDLEQQHLLLSGDRLPPLIPEVQVQPLLLQDNRKAVAVPLHQPVLQLHHLRVEPLQVKCPQKGLSLPSQRPRLPPQERRKRHRQQHFTEVPPRPSRLRPPVVRLIVVRVRVFARSAGFRRVLGVLGRVEDVVGLWKVLWRLPLPEEFPVEFAVSGHFLNELVEFVFERVFFFVVLDFYLQLAEFPPQPLHFVLLHF